MPDTAPAAKIKIGNIEVPEAVIRRVTRPTGQPAGQTSSAPVENPLFKIVFSPDVEPEEKRKQLAAFLTFSGTKVEMREHMKAREEFEDYLEAERKRMQVEMLHLTDTDTFAVLQGVINDMNTDLLNFEEQMKPLTDILDAIYKLQTDGKAIDAFREIQIDRKAEAQQNTEREANEAAFQGLQNEITDITRSVAELGEERSWFGFGNVSESARKKIAVKTTELTDLQSRLQALETKLQTVANTTIPTSMPDYANEKQQLRNLLDISGPEHCAKVRALVDGALKFVDTSSSRIGEVREHFTKMGNQMEHLKDANSKMAGVRAVMSESMDDAKRGTMSLHDQLATPPTGEGVINKITREEKLEAVDEHVKALDNAARNNTVSLAELTSEAITIRTARDEHQQMLEKTRILHTQGIAGIASRLNTTINALSIAALNESSKIAGQTLRRMIEDTNETTQKEVIRSALGVQDMTVDVQTVLGDLANLGETLRASSTIYRSGLSDLHVIMEKAKEMTTTVQGDIKDASGIHAEAAASNVAVGKPNGSVQSANANKADSPFGI